ncbi:MULTISPECIES: toluene-4-monooxygenase system B family protein [Nostocales]|uniref:Toluene monooxygenase n=2 Tax=Nostocales TaxID=1161 RepID=A0A0C1R4H1_9CYAN|nr:toluene-4-monooxygenase system B family protein [Tolypothrix bouteillei]KAF3886656.1 toluene monooxygenase [Tolypothrix bouteillei VB521301]
MATIPLMAGFRGDFALILAFVENTDTMDVVAQKVAHHVIGKRLPSKKASMKVKHNERVLESHVTVAQANIQPQDYIEVFYDE